MKASAFLRSARTAAGLTQSELARAAGVDRSTVSLIESGKRSPSLEKLSRIMRAAGRQLTSVPAGGLTAIDTASDIREHLQSGDSERAFRVWLAYSDSLADVAGVNRILLTATEPPSTGSDVWDAAIAAVTEHWLMRDDLTTPAWLSDDSRTLAVESVLPVNEWSTPGTIASVPEAFRKHGVLVDESTLSSA